MYERQSCAQHSFKLYKPGEQGLKDPYFKYSNENYRNMKMITTNALGTGGRSILGF